MAELKLKLKLRRSCVVGSGQGLTSALNRKQTWKRLKRGAARPYLVSNDLNLQLRSNHQVISTS